MLQDILVRYVYSYCRKGNKLALPAQIVFALLYSSCPPFRLSYSRISPMTLGLSTLSCPSNCSVSRTAKSFSLSISLSFSSRFSYSSVNSCNVFQKFDGKAALYTYTSTRVWGALRAFLPEAPPVLLFSFSCCAVMFSSISTNDGGVYKPYFFMKRKQTDTDNDLQKPTYTFKKLQIRSRSDSDPDPSKYGIFV